MLLERVVDVLTAIFRVLEHERDDAQSLWTVRTCSQHYRDSDGMVTTFGHSVQRTPLDSNISARETPK